MSLALAVQMKGLGTILLILAVTLIGSFFRAASSQDFNRREFATLANGRQVFDPVPMKDGLDHSPLAFPEFALAHDQPAAEQQTVDQSKSNDL